MHKWKRSGQRIGYPASLGRGRRSRLLPWRKGGGCSRKPELRRPRSWSRAVGHCGYGHSKKLPGGGCSRTMRRFSWRSQNWSAPHPLHTYQTPMKEALWQWGNNPIDFIIDCYYVPFSITSFYDTINANLKFGTYQFPDTSYPAIKETNGNRLTLFNTTFEGTYGDWRDYTQFTYDLFLPFIGFVPLDPQKYINHLVKCEMMFDITTHNLRYYLFVDGLITDRFDGSVGVNIPLMASDVVNKAKHDRDLRYGMASDVISGIGSVAGAKTVGQAISGGISAIADGIKKYEELSINPASHVEGAFSSSMNVYDVSYAYLRITEKQMIIPSETHAIYGYPSYYMGTIGNLRGYCEINDIQLKSNCTESEYNEILDLLKGGVII